jgi:hypothetical protein
MKRADKKQVNPMSIRSSVRALVVCTLVGCGGGSGGGCNNEPPGTSDRSPFRDGWQVEADLDFVHTNADDVAEIFDLSIGGREDNDNFANRGDVIVTFDGPPRRILVELRRFTFAPNESAAEVDFEDLSLWAFTSALGRPQDQMAEDDCVVSGWQNACQVRVYYDGLSQLKRSGADIRVTLPADYRQKINIVTQDNIEEESYLNRGNVCVSDLFATAIIETESGKVWASLADDVTPAPKCSQAEIDACESYVNPDTMVAAPWAPECDCIAIGGGEFGRLEITSRDETAADILVDMPEGLWASVKGENQSEGQEEAGEHCEAAIEVANFLPNDTGNDFSWQKFGSVNYPGVPAINGAGFSVQAISRSCEPVAYTENPEDFVGVANGDEQSSEERGNIRICTDCITQSCSDLIP